MRLLIDNRGLGELKKKITLLGLSMLLVFSFCFMSTPIAEAAPSVKELQKQITALTAKVKSLTASLTKAQKDNAQLKKQVTTKTTEAAELKKQVTAKTTELSTLKKQYSSKLAEIKVLEEKVGKYEELVGENGSKLEEFEELLELNKNFTTDMMKVKMYHELSSEFFYYHLLGDALYGFDYGLVDAYMYIVEENNSSYINKVVKDLELGINAINEYKEDFKGLEARAKALDVYSATNFKLLTDSITLYTEALNEYKLAANHLSNFASSKSNVHLSNFANSLKYAAEKIDLAQDKSFDGMKIYDELTKNY
jgi:outer membrane murein-binding lipoprotein Lpp